VAEPGRQRIDVVPRPGVGTVLRRVLALRCPACGTTRLYERRFVMRAACAACGLPYEPEQGFFVGAIYLNYAVTTVIGLGSVLLLDTLRPMSITAQLAVAVPLMLIVPVLFFHHSRSLWLGTTYLLAGVDRPSRSRR
jgi:uncharacterized protein (DUF983 family)